MSLTAAQQDYLEAIYRLELVDGDSGVRISDIAAHLGTRLPTVTRTVQKLTALGFVAHDARKAVRLTEHGRKVAGEILHRHKDLVVFFTRILGLEKSEAENDVCQIEHGFSGKAAQRLHEFLLYHMALDESERELFDRFRAEATSGKRDFRNLPSGRTVGWRM
jgi:DtxR family Mn-dependent transcriptional regulator